MRQSSDWLLDGRGAKRRRQRKRRRALMVVGVILACLLVAGGAYFGVKYGPRRERAPGTTASARKSETLSADAGAEEDKPIVVVPYRRVKGLYVTAYSAGLADRMAHYIEICDTTEINALVIDVKDDRGQITFLNSIEGAAKASFNIIPDIEKTMALLKEHDVYTIARLVCFKDPIWSKLEPGQAIHNGRGGVWKDGGGVAWLDPYNPGAWEYIAAVAKEAARLGFDEIQLDYVRFPTDGNTKDIAFGAAAEGKTRAQAIGEFLQYIREALLDTDVKLSADIFGITAINSGDFENIGQDLATLLRGTDTICPMVYPSHFANKRQNGVGQTISGALYTAPDLEPYEVVFNTLLLIKGRLPEEGRHAGLRPYLQDFTASYLGNGYYQTYTAEQVRAQIQAVYDAGFEEWILWNAAAVYSEGALEGE